jgi:hypothetical protein
MNNNFLKDLMRIFLSLPLGSDKKKLENIIYILKDKKDIKTSLKVVEMFLTAEKSKRNINNSKSIKIWEEVLNIFVRNLK